MSLNLSKVALLLAGLWGGTNPVPLSNRNLIVDGGFDIWNTTVSSTLATAGGYTQAVMHLAGCGTGGAGTFTQTDLRPSGPAYSESGRQLAFVHNQTTGATGTVAARTAGFILHRIEHVARTAGRSATYQIRLWSTGANITIPSVIASISYGTGGAPSPGVNFDKAVNWVVTSTPKKFSVRLDVPASTGKTFGTNGDDYLAVGIWLPPGVTFVLVGTEAQLELSDPNSSPATDGTGGAPTTIEYRGEQAELARVSRYWQYLVGYIFGVGAVQSATTLYFEVKYAPKRAIPALTPVGGFSIFTPQTGTISASGGVSNGSASTDSAFMTATASGMVGGQAGWCSNVGNAGAIIVDARL
ncbi:hypothetical protein [Paraburkholderia sp. SIMBA_054]|uniref:hypothetical protein n=1 Tax=Paraburkholderia sp. SIMBA_054 TaxID=3085795 RepID=UPI00397A8E6D